MNALHTRWIASIDNHHNIIRRSGISRLDRPHPIVVTENYNCRNAHNNPRHNLIELNLPSTNRAIFHFKSTTDLYYATQNKCDHITIYQFLSISCVFCRNGASDHHSVPRSNHTAQYTQ